MVRKWVWFMALGCTSLVLSCSRPEEAQGGAVQTSASPKDQYFDAEGVRLHYTEQGEGEPIVLIHGFALNVDRWHSSGVPEALAGAGYRVLAIDCRGHGKSEKPHDPEAYGGEMARDVVRLLDHLELEKAHVVGYSMGGIITNKLRELHPERLQTAVLGGSGWQKKGDYALADMTGPDIADSLERTGSFEHMLRKFTEHREPPPTEEEIRTRNQRMMEGNDLEALEAVLRAWDGFGVAEEDLRENEVPTLAVVGANDPLLEKARALEKVMARLEVVVIGGADHGTALTHPQFIEAVRSFLSHHPLTMASSSASDGR